MLPKLKEAYEYRDFLFQLVYQQLHQRYQGSILGFLWTLALPLLTFASFSLIFSLLNNWDLKDYGIYFFSGYIFWILFSNSCSLGAESVVGNAAYVTRVYIPKILLPISSVALSLVDLLASFVILVILMLAWGAPLSSAMLFLPVAVLIALPFVLGAAMLCALANVFLRDFRHLLASLLFLWFFFCPILWKGDIAPARAKVLLLFNPLTPFLAMFQMPVWKGELPTGQELGIAVALALGTLLLGIYCFQRAEGRFYYYL